MTSKHSPGPWYTTQARYVANDKVLICRVLDANLSDEEVEANVHLIETAPELLEQLEALVVQLEATRRLVVPPGVKQVIAKARGRA